MTEQETIKIVTLIVMSYPSNEKFKEDATLKGMVAIWKNLFRDDNAQLVELAVHKHISTSKWPPSIAEIREQMIEISRPDIIPPDIAWSAVSDLLTTQNEFGYFDVHDYLPESIARVVETIGWSNLYNMHINRGGHNADGMDRVAFMDLYKPAYERTREQAMLPESIRVSCERKVKELGGENLQLIEKIHQERIKHDEYYNNLGLNFADEITGIGDVEINLLGGASNE